MSTRTNVLVTDGTRENTVQMYHHHDGYPSGVGYDLANYVKKLLKSKKGRDTLNDTTALVEWLCDYKRKDEYEKEGEVSLHGDIEYLYIVDTTAKTITCFNCLAWSPADESAFLAVEGRVAEAAYFGIVFTIPFGKGVREINNELKNEDYAKDRERKHELLKGMLERGELGDSFLWSY